MLAKTVDAGIDTEKQDPRRSVSYCLFDPRQCLLRASEGCQDVPGVLGVDKAIGSAEAREALEDCQSFVSPPGGRIDSTQFGELSRIIRDRHGLQH